jgi:hypothetical protein
MTLRSRSFGITPPEIVEITPALIDKKVTVPIEVFEEIK